MHTPKDDGRTNYNPYAPPSGQSLAPEAQNRYLGPLAVSISPIDIYQRGFAFVQPQYWMMLWVSITGLVLGGLVPMYIIFGAMTVGIFLCLKQVEQKRPVEFATLFQGLNQFLDSLVVVLIAGATMFVVMTPLVVAYIVTMVTIVAGTGPEPKPPPALITVILVWSILFTLVMFAGFLPFLFSFQLIADRKASGLAAVKQSFQGVWMNAGGILGFVLVTFIVQISLALMCYIPAILFIPIQFASAFVLYRDIFPEPTIDGPLQ